MTEIDRPDGRSVRIEQKAYKVVGKVSGRAFMLLEGADGERFEYPVAEFRRLAAAGCVQHANHDAAETQLLTQEEFEEQSFRVEVLRRFYTYRHDGMNNQVAASRVKKDLLSSTRYHVRAHNFPSIRTIQIWIRLSREHGEQALSGRLHKAGNRIFRYDLLFEDIVLDLLEETFLTSDRFTITTLQNAAETKYLEACRKKKIEPKCHGRRCVQSIVDRLPHRDVVKLRLDEDTARSRNRSSAKHFNIKHPFDRIEIDSTWADCFVLLGRDKVIIRLYITIAVDCATGWIVGLTVSENPPTNLTTVETLLQAMVETSEEFFDRHGIENRFQAFGSLMVVVSDQGSENSGDYIRQMLTLTPVELQQGQPKKAEGRPFAESAHGVMKKFIIQLPGATQTKDMPAKTRTEVAMKEAELTVDEFITRLQKWRYDVYAVTPRRRIQNAFRIYESPMDAWQRLEAEAYIPDAPTPEKLDELFFCQRDRRKIWIYGLEYERVQYWSKELDDLRLDKQVKEIEISINPMDIRCLIAIDPVTMKPIKVPAKDPELPAISFAELKRIREAIGLPKGAPIRAKEILAELVKGSHHGKRAGRTKRKKVVDQARRQRRDQRIIEESQSGNQRSNPAESSRHDQPVSAVRPSFRTKITRKSSK